MVVSDRLSVTDRVTVPVTPAVSVDVAVTVPDSESVYVSVMSRVSERVWGYVNEMDLVCVLVGPVLVIVSVIVSEPRLSVTSCVGESDGDGDVVEEGVGESVVE